MRIDMETWLGLTLRSSGRVCDICSQVAHAQLLQTPTSDKIRGVVARYGNKKRRFAMLLCFGGTVLVLLFYVRGSKVWHAQSRKPLEMLVGTSWVLKVPRKGPLGTSSRVLKGTLLVVPTFPTSATREVRSGDNCNLNGKPSIAVAKIRRRSQPQLAAKLARLAICYGN